MVRVPLSADEVERGRRLGELLRAARGPATIGAVALAAGLSAETVRKIESGRVPTPSFNTVAALASVLHLSLDELWSHVCGLSRAS